MCIQHVAGKENVVADLLSRIAAIEAKIQKKNSAASKVSLLSLDIQDAAEMDVGIAAIASVVNEFGQYPALYNNQKLARS